MRYPFGTHKLFHSKNEKHLCKSTVIPKKLLATLINSRTKPIKSHRDLLTQRVWSNYMQFLNNLTVFFFLKMCKSFFYGLLLGKRTTNKKYHKRIFKCVRFWCGWMRFKIKAISWILRFESGFLSRLYLVLHHELNGMSIGALP